MALYKVRSQVTIEFSASVDVQYLHRRFVWEEEQEDELFEMASKQLERYLARSEIVARFQEVKPIERVNFIPIDDELYFEPEDPYETYQSELAYGDIVPIGQVELLKVDINLASTLEIDWRIRQVSDEEASIEISYFIDEVLNAVDLQDSPYCVVEYQLPALTEIIELELIDFR